ncbi:hypothetical protein M8818_003778 [Zalaria obscura]|uniref:Uncharacterized protein n=1 Tax=Zalaria obscura TaxID=2024903 RepID=A0ACC3SDE6_9PEZI
MGLLKHLRSKSRMRDGPSSPPQKATPQPARYGRDFTARLPEDLIRRILIEVCPHTQDESYEPSERSSVSDGCMLCDLRDLAVCAKVCRKWYSIAQNLLYNSVRIDAVHYCELEEILAEKRARKSFMKKSVEAGDIPAIRLSLFCRTVRESAALASRVQLLKLPYMTRETCKGDLARTVSALPNLRYVDLPDGAFTGDPSCHTLVNELQARCPDIRKMSYRAGAEQALELLARRCWQSLEILELSEIAVEPATLRIVLASLPTLHDLTISSLPYLDDSIFQSTPQLPDFPPLHVLGLENTPRITAAGLRTHLASPANREILSQLCLHNTGVTVPDLPLFLWDAAHLTSLTIIETVSRSLPLGQLEPLTSISLKTLHFEIVDSDDAHGLQKPAATHYAYLAQSLHANALPALTQLFVRDPEFPELLLLPPPKAPFGGMGGEAGQRASVASLGPPRGFNQPLEVYSKGLDELEWVFTSIASHSPSSPHRNSVFNSAANGRPLSSYSASRGLGPQWAQGGFGGEARKSVVVGNGFGGFLAVPSDEVPRPMSAQANYSSSPSGGGRYNAHHSTFGHLGTSPSQGKGHMSWYGGAADLGSPSRGWGNGSVGSGNSGGGGATGGGGAGWGGGSLGAGSVGSESSRMSWLKPPPSLAGSAGSGSGHRKVGSKHDLWR